MLLIDENNDLPLPKEFHHINNLCAIIYDQLTDILTNENYKALTHTGLSIDPEKATTAEELEDGNIHVFDWLAKHKHDKTLCDSLTKHITLSILSDFVNFIYESLNSARKGKMSVAYALLRKPLTDELLIFEQLLSNNEDFIDRFFIKADQKLYDPHKTRNQLSIIEQAIQKLSVKFPFSADTIYKLRYDKSCEAGVNGISNQAIHIVTSDPNYRTSDQNLNFIFSGVSDYPIYCKQYYFFVPLLLLYTAAVVDEIVFQYLTEEEQQAKKILRSFQRVVAAGMLLDTEDNEDDILKVFSETFTYDCDNCGNIAEPERADIESFLKTGNFRCSKCSHSSDFRTVESVSAFTQILSMVE